MPGSRKNFLQGALGGWDQVLARSPLLSASGLGFWLLPGFRSLFSGNTWVGGFTCLLPVTGSCANACYLNPRWAGPEELSVAARAQPARYVRIRAGEAGSGQGVVPQSLLLGKSGLGSGSPSVLNGDHRSRTVSPPGLREGQAAQPESMRCGARGYSPPSLGVPRIALR